MYNAGEHLSFIGVDFWTALFTLLNFMAVFFVGKRFLWKPVMNIIESRQKEINDLYADADSARDNALAMQEEYQQKLSAATQTGEQLVQQALARGRKQEDAIIRQAELQAAAILEKARADILQEKKQAMNDTKNEISGLAMAIATKVVERELNEADHRRLIDQFIDELGDSL